MRYGGTVFTQAGIRVTGELDQELGIVKHSPAQLYVSFPVRSALYSVVRCENCFQEFVVGNAPPNATWPNHKIEISADVPEPIRNAVKNAKQAHSVGAELAALLAARTALTRLQREQSASSLKELADSGKITRVLYAQADEVRLWANMVGHEDVEQDQPSAEDVEHLLGYLDLIIEAVYLHPAKLQSLQAKRAAAKAAKGEK
ncbi:MAG: hypothetical protein WBQ86_11760 [Candidatus Binatus sp.]